MDFSKIEFSEAKRILAAALLTSDDEDSKPPTTMEKRKTKMVRFTQQQIKNCMAFSADISDDDDEESLPKLSEVLSKDILDRVPPEVLDSLIEFENTRGERKARWEKLRDDLHEERDTPSTRSMMTKMMTKMKIIKFLLELLPLAAAEGSAMG